MNRIVREEVFMIKLSELEQHNEFIQRHIGVTPSDLPHMLETLSVSSIDELMKQTIPAQILSDASLNMDSSRSEHEVLAELQQLSEKNECFKSYIGMGYHETFLPSVIQRNVLENPGWYTAYTPYQPEISQGRLEALLHFQQMTIDLTGMDIANASLLDEATAAAEAMALCKRMNRKNNSNTFFVADDLHPQIKNVLKTRAHFFGFELTFGDSNTDLLGQNYFGAILAYPNTTGAIEDPEALIREAQSQNTFVCVNSDILSLVLLKSPGEMGADIAFGSTQRFGVPMGFGGPHAAYFAVKDAYKRSMPGRLIGASVDSKNRPALRMALQTREQHIRRDKATSNICTAQALLANIAAFYAMYHGKEGLRHIAQRVHRLASLFALGMQQRGVQLLHDSWFDTVTFCVGKQQQGVIYQYALDEKVNLRKVDSDKLSISFDECKTRQDIVQLFDVFLGSDHGLCVEKLDEQLRHDAFLGIPESLQRQSNFLQHASFSAYHSETEMMRYLKRLENKDYSLTHGMIPLGSCTMKLNAASEMIPISWPKFANVHPFAPMEQVQGYHEMIQRLCGWLADITGYDQVSMQPNSGAQGEYAGLIAIKKYHESIGQGHRDICLIPKSAHGTNPASASMVGLKIIVVECDKQGNVDEKDLAEKAEKYRERLSCFIVTYPSTHGVFEESIVSLCDITHQYGGQVYLDGANLNAQIGFVKPGHYGADVSHLNLHKTFSIPHGGGGPGMGPIGVKAHLAPFLPSENTLCEEKDNYGVISAAPFGSAGILAISYAYIRMLGKDGLTHATMHAILNANYIAERLADSYPILYRGKEGRVAHECIVDIRPLKARSQIDEEDIAKRLMDYGFHAPTMSFPVAGTLMIEPTESESLKEIDRFCDAMIAIRAEIEKIIQGQWPKDDNPLVNAPHTLADLQEPWERSYSIESAITPKGVDATSKYWPTNNRVDNVKGDRQLICCCI